MAATKLDTLEQLVNDVVCRVSPPSEGATCQVLTLAELVQTGKALKASSKNGKRAPAVSNMTKIVESNEKFNYTLDDLESEIVGFVLKPGALPTDTV